MNFSATTLEGFKMRKKIWIAVSLLISMIIACDLTDAIVSSLGKITEGIK
jgi:hypothetical protein